MVGPRSQCGRGGEEKNFQPVPGLEHLIVQPVVQGCTTELPLLFRVFKTYFATTAHTMRNWNRNGKSVIEN
jgi:hypothetical protein